MKRVRIGITCNFLTQDISAYEGGIGTKEQEWQLLAQDYTKSIWKAGGLPVLIPVDQDAERSLEFLDLVDGLLISGGNDVSPMLYGERFTKCGALDLDRDRMEIALLKKALELEMPVLGICRGLQLMNVAFGGTLYQDLESEQYPLHSIFNCKRNIPTHRVDVKEHTALAGLVGAGEFWVNSFHHQGIRRLGEGLVCAATTDEGLTEAVEVTGKPFALAVQWHPEMMYDSAQHQSIFKGFVSACR